jgi:hypothetical protein
MNNVLGMLMLAVPIWPVLAVGSSIVFYARHANRVDRERRLPIAVYVIALVVSGGVAAFGGMLFGAQWACARPDGGNLCGLVGVLVTGPMAGTLAIILVGLAVSLKRVAE